MMNLTKIVLITGVTRGLGLAMAEKFVALGHTVLGCGRSQSAIEKLRRAHPRPHDFDVVDVADDGTVRAWPSDFSRAMGRPIFCSTMRPSSIRMPHFGKFRAKNSIW